MDEFVFNYKQYKKKILTNHKHKKFIKKQKKIFISFYSIILIICLLAISINLLLPKKPKKFSFFAIELNKFATYKEACCYLENFDADNYCYIHFDLDYHVLVSVYENKNDAQNVERNLKKKYPNINIYEFSYTIKSKNNFSLNQNKTLMNFTINSTNIFKQLISISNMLDTKELNYKTASLTIKNLYDEFDGEFNKLSTSFQSNKIFELISIYPKKIKESFENLNLTDENELHKTLRCETIKMIANFTFFACSL